MEINSSPQLELKLSAQNIAYTICGNGEPLVLLHGFLGSGDDWRGVLPSLSSDYKVVNIDLPNCGHSKETFLSKPLDMDSMLLAVKSVLEAEKLEKIHLLGYSLGGRVALNLALEFPDLLSSLALVSASPGIENEEDRKARAEVDRQRALSILEGGLEKFLLKWYQASLFGNLNKSDDFPDLIARRINENSNEKTAELIVAMSPGLVKSRWGDLDKLSMPVQWFYGEQDLKYSKMVENAASLSSNITTTKIANAAHALHLEQKDEFLSSYQEFLNQLTD